MAERIIRRSPRLAAKFDTTPDNNNGEDNLPPPIVKAMKEETDTVSLRAKIEEYVETEMPYPTAFTFPNHEPLLNNVEELPSNYDAKHRFTIPETEQEINKLRELTMLDQIEETDDTDRYIWTPTKIVQHFRKRDKSGVKRPKFRVEWQSQGSSWVDGEALYLHASEMVSEYVIRNELTQSPCFQRMVKPLVTDDEVTAFRSSTEERIAGKAGTDYNARKFKFGLEVPRSAQHALYLDKTNNFQGEDSWRHAMDKELKQLKDYQTFKSPSSDEDLEGFRKIPYHLVFDVKFDLRKKARLVAGGHKTDPPKEDIYSGVVDFMSVRMGFMFAAMNDLKVCAADVGNAFLYGKTREKVFITAGKEF
ncbi:MAG: hypothetical protein ACRCT2_00500, partial [Plesiomonas shigelloides]